MWIIVTYLIDPFQLIIHVHTYTRTTVVQNGQCYHDDHMCDKRVKSSAYLAAALGAWHSCTQSLKAVSIITSLHLLSGLRFILVLRCDS